VARVNSDIIETLGQSVISDCPALFLVTAREKIYLIDEFYETPMFEYRTSVLSAETTYDIALGVIRDLKRRFKNHPHMVDFYVQIAPFALSNNLGVCSEKPADADTQS
jgi:hypothetical protein